MAVSKASANAITPAAKGAIAIGSGTNAASILTVGSNDQVLTADSTQTTGVKWAAASSGALSIMIPSSTANSGGTVSTSGGAVTFSGVSSVSLNGVFTSTYANYVIIMSELIGSTDSAVNMRFRASGTDSSTGYYVGGFYVLYTGTTVTGFNLNNATSQDVSSINNTLKLGTFITLQNPQLATTTAYQIQPSRRDAGMFESGYHSVTTAYDGFTLIPGTGTMSGVVRVYGIAN